MSVDLFLTKVKKHMEGMKENNQLIGDNRIAQLSRTFNDCVLTKDQLPTKMIDSSKSLSQLCDAAKTSFNLTGEEETFYNQVSDRLKAVFPDNPLPKMKDFFSKKTDTLAIEKQETFSFFLKAKQTILAIGKECHVQLPEIIKRYNEVYTDSPIQSEEERAAFGSGVIGFLILQNISDLFPKKSFPQQVILNLGSLFNDLFQGSLEEAGNQITHQQGKITQLLNQLEKNVHIKNIENLIDQLEKKAVEHPKNTKAFSTITNRNSFGSRALMIRFFHAHINDWIRELRETVNAYKNDPNNSNNQAFLSDINEGLADAQKMWRDYRIEVSKSPVRSTTEKLKKKVTDKIEERFHLNAPPSLIHQKSSFFQPVSNELKQIDTNIAALFEMAKRS